MKIINAAIVYLEEDDLFSESLNKPIDDVRIYDFKNPKIIKVAEVVILKG